MKLTKAQRHDLRLMFGAKCAYCGVDLPEKGWHADHIQPVDREWWKAHRSPTTPHWDGKKIVMVEQDRKVTLGYPERDVIDNLFPSCQPCNIDKGPMSLEGWRGWLENKPDVLRRNSSAWRHAERFGLVCQVETKVVFYFERVGRPVTA